MPQNFVSEIKVETLKSKSIFAVLRKQGKNQIKYF